MITIAYYSYSCLICPKHNVKFVASHFDLTKTLEGRHHYPSFADKETDWKRLFYPYHTYTISRLKTKFLRCEVYVLSIMPHVMQYTFLKQVSPSFPTPLSLPDFPSLSCACTHSPAFFGSAFDVLPQVMHFISSPVQVYPCLPTPTLKRFPSLLSCNCSIIPYNFIPHEQPY